LEILPQRHPLVLVDRVTDVVAFESINGHKMITYSDFWCAGHLPGAPLMPGSLVIEALVQVCSLLAYASEPYNPTTSRLYLLGIDKAKFRHSVAPGDRLDLYAKVVQHRTNTWKFSTEATVEGTLCAQADILASIVDHR
jgi:3-hydroxyacyl-[acyl-carrier-protein] dehydratase